MMRSLLAIACGLILGTALTAEAPRDEKNIYIDLQPKAEHKLSDNYPSKRYEDNDLGDLPKGKQVLGGVPFLIGERYIVLGSKRLPTMPEKIEGIAVGTTAKRLQFLHATAYRTVPDDTLIGKYIVNYDDKTKSAIEIVIGKDVRDWQKFADDPPVTRGKIVWTGTNKNVVRNGGTLRHYLLTWKNPKPEKRITTMDYISTMTDSAPFCVAITADQK